MNGTQESGFPSFTCDESLRDDCFLCRPSAQLLAHVGEECYTMAGLGPLCDGYAIIATYSHGSIEHPHSPNLMDKLAEYAECVQRVLSDEFGSCVLAEHGKMPICKPNRQSDTHCFHPHFLLFPGASNPLKDFREYFRSQGNCFRSLAEALRYAASLPNYLLASSKSSEYVVFQTADGLPRQFARAIVADALGKGHLASWQTHPNQEWAARNAANLRRFLFLQNVTTNN